MKRILSLILSFAIVLCMLTACGSSVEVPSSDDTMTKLNKAVEYIQSKTDFKPDVAVVLGSGYSEFAEGIDVAAEIDFRDIPGMPVPTNPSHPGKMIFGTVEGVNIVCLNGRVHYYEGYTMEQVVMPTRVMAMLGAKTIILTNSSGAFADDIDIGDIAMITDQIASYVPSPLIGASLDELGDRFVDMTYIYDKDIIQAVEAGAADKGINLKEGVYMQVTGPQFETPAEMQKYKDEGADLIGMSTACEAIAARQMGLNIVGISLATAKGAGLVEGTITDEEVLEIANAAMKDMTKVLKIAIREAGARL